MTTLSVHGLDRAVERRIREEAKRTGSSMNQVMKRLLATAVGCSPSESVDRRQEFMDVFGVWTRADQEEFEHATEAMSAVDSRDWQ